jgi:AcrR family transcriptional regulator
VAPKKGKGWDSRAALLEAAWAILHEQGAAGMSVDAVVARAGLSKGTFFHFLPAKQELLDALCARIAEESWKHAGGILERADLDPVARLDLFFRASRSWRTERPKAVVGLWQELARDENAALMAKVRALAVARMAPPLARLFEEANRTGRMRVADPEVVAPLAVEWISAAAEGNMRRLAGAPGPAALDLALRRANATMDAFERMLGTVKGAFTRVDRGILAKIAAGVPAAGGAGGGGDASSQDPPARPRGKGRVGRRGRPGTASTRGLAKAPEGRARRRSP